MKFAEDENFNQSSAQKFVDEFTKERKREKEEKLKGYNDPKNLR